MNVASYRLLPKLPGVYLFKDKKGAVIYVGKAKNLRDRVSSYFQPVEKLLPKTAQLVGEIKTINHIKVESEIDALILEANLIKKYRPHYNFAGKDDKRFPFIEIRVKDPVPIVKIVRQVTDPKKLYFGPYPTGSDVTGLLRFLRRLFPFVSQNHPGNLPCLRSHLGLCPCQNLKAYRPNLKKLVAFLSGKRTQVQKQLAKEMDALAQAQRFEEANSIKLKLTKIESITSPRLPAWAYESNPNLVSDRRTEELSSLQHLLGLPRLAKIECYDISNTAGQNSTGSQVTFINGEPAKNLYRRYKIKTQKGDVLMIKEVVSRRLKSKIPLPDLMVIDGGKEHLISAPVPVVGLAKRRETIYFADKTFHLPTDSPALQLLQRLRDEAHRFSRKYHFLLRTKSMLA